MSWVQLSRVDAWKPPGLPVKKAQAFTHTMQYTIWYTHPDFVYRGRDASSWHPRSRKALEIIETSRKAAKIIEILHKSKIWVGVHKYSKKWHKIIQKQQVGKAQVFECRNLEHEWKTAKLGQFSKNPYLVALSPWNTLATKGVTISWLSSGPTWLAGRK